VGEENGVVMNDRANAPVIIIKRKKVVAGGGHHGGAWKVAMFYDPIVGGAFCAKFSRTNPHEKEIGRDVILTDV
jgi:hypothetical protein